MTVVAGPGLLPRIWARLPLYRKPTILGLSIFGYLLFAGLMLVVPSTPNFNGFIGVDSLAYWYVDPFHPYVAPLGSLASFTYSPAFALVMCPAHLLPFAAFFVLWDSFLIANLVWLTRRMALAWMFFLPVPLELFAGNVHLLLATVCVLGFEYPALWSIGLLTKITPGVSLLWFIVRREWRSLAWALCATTAISAVSLVIAPGAWFDWVKFLVTSGAAGAGPNDRLGALLPPLWLRTVVAALLVVWGARTDRRWVVPVATAVAMPVVWINSLAVLVAIPRLRNKTAAAGDEAAIESSASPIVAVP
jgi:hypothetical protein